jgi:PGAP1-like protein.
MIRKMVIFIGHLGGFLMHINKIMGCLLILLLSGCGKQIIIREKLYIKKPAIAQPIVQKTSPKECEYITVWIHGTKLVPLQILHRIFHSPDGLVPASSFDKQYHLRSIADTLSATDNAQYSSEYMFLFGWSGALAFEERAKAAKELHTQLKPVIKSYEQKYGKRPKIRIITHSHGGNVALNLAKINDASDFDIDELILLACPVQESTAELIKNPKFKEVFVLYSSFDLMQIIDPQGLYSHDDDRPLLSQRRFPMQSNITQVKMKLNGCALLHSDFIRVRFVAMLPEIIDKMREFHKQCACGTCLANEQTQQILSIYT